MAAAAATGAATTTIVPAAIRSPIPIYKYMDGVCASAATIISVAEHQRFISSKRSAKVGKMRLPLILGPINLHSGNRRPEYFHLTYIL